MRVNKSFKIILIAFVLTTIGLLGISQSANAATKWKNGTPKAIRGTWVAKTKEPKDNEMNWSNKYDILTLTSKKMTIYQPSAFVNATKLSYHHKAGSSTYYIKGKDAGFKTYSYQKLVVSGKKLKQAQYGNTINAENTFEKELMLLWSHWLYKK